MLESVAVTPPTPALPARLRFAGVVLDTHGHRLLVDGRQRACSTRAMALLQLLCQRPGQVWPRAELIDALWPGGQVVADESLSQLVFRLRSALGPYAECIATVRGVGVRLDARFESDDASTEVLFPAIEAGGTAASVPTGPAEPGQPLAQDAAMGAPAGSIAPPPYRDTDRRATGPVEPGSPAVEVADAGAARVTGGGARVRWLPTLIALVLVLSAGGWLAWPQGFFGAHPNGDFDATVVDAGMGLQRGDLAAMPEQVLRLVSDAFEQERLGDRERSQALMEAAHGSDASSPVPALMLALWSGATGDADAASRWLAAADARLAGEDAPYLLLLAGYVRAETGARTSDIAHQAGALLDLRPDAWFLRLARAHVLGAMGLRERALAELQAIDVGNLEHPRLAMALADRASFGDVEGARSILAGLGPDPDNLDLALARARIDWSAGDLAAARAGFVASAELARQQARVGLRDRALAYVGILDLLAGDAQGARAPLERARAGAGERRAGNLELDLTLLLVHVQAELGRDEAVRAELRHAADLARRLPGSDLGWFTRLVALRLAPELEPEVGGDFAEPGGDSLIEARRALAAGDRARALAGVQRAVEQGALEARLAEETRLLLAELGQPAPAGPPLDPPHPPLTRFAIRRLADGLTRAAASSPD